MARSAKWVGRVAACLGLLYLAGCNPGATRPSQHGAPEAWVTISGSRLPVELALTPEEQRLGLGQRDRLAWGTGMLFIHDSPEFRRYWMKDMRFDIDIIWIRGDRIVEIAHGVIHVPGENGPTVISSQLVDRVLEVPAGYARTQNWRPGLRVEVERLDSGH